VVTPVKLELLLKATDLSWVRLPIVKRMIVY